MRFTVILPFLFWLSAAQASESPKEMPDSFQLTLSTAQAQLVGRALTDEVQQINSLLAALNRQIKAQLPEPSKAPDGK